MGSARRRLIVAALFLGVVAVAAAVHARPAPANTLPSGFADQLVFSGLQLPTRVAFAADGTVFIAEKAGRILRYSSIQASASTVVADLRTQVFSGWDRGIVGLAVDPAFTTGRPYLYALFTLNAPPGGTVPTWNGDDCPSPPGPTTNGCVVTGRLVRLTIVNGVATETKVLIDDWCQQFTSHSIGDLGFGPDGALYASAGDGASYTFVDKGQVPGGVSPTVLKAKACDDPTNEGGSLRSLDALTPNDPHTLDGTIIRIDPDTGAARPDNPWASSSDPNRRRIVAFGMRNPWRFTFRPGTSELWASDTGWKSYEEINRIPLGTGAVPNLGWPCYEGVGKQPEYDAAAIPICQNLDPATVTAPHHSYGRVAIEGCGKNTTAASAVAFATNLRYPAAYQGALFFSDYARGCIFTMRLGKNGLPDTSTVAAFVTGRPVVDLQTGPGRDLFYLDISRKGCNAADCGELRRIVASGTNRAPVAGVTAAPVSGPAPLTAAFDAGSSSDPDAGDVLRYEWDLDADGQFDDGTGRTATATYPTPRTLAVRVRVTDSYGLSSIAQVTVSAGNDAPVPAIATPAATVTWAAGDPVAFSGSAQDAQQGALPPSALQWRLVIEHCGDGGVQCHEHEVQSWSGVASGQFYAPAHDWPSRLKLLLTAKDNAGASATVTRTLEPRTVSLAVASNPPGISIDAVDTASPAPFNRTVIAGTTVTVSAPATAVVNGVTWTFASWSDGGARSHDITPTTNTTLTATYTTTPTPQGLTLDTWTNWGGSQLADIPTGTPPTATITLNSSATPSNRGNDFGQRVRGLLTPATTGTYRLYLSSDDEGVLAFNPTGPDPTGRQTVARVIDWTNPNSFTEQPGQRSGEFNLQAGTSYWIEAFAKEGGNLDHLSIAWTGPGIPTPTLIPANRLTPTTNGCTGWCPPPTSTNGMRLDRWANRPGGRLTDIPAGIAPTSTGLLEGSVTPYRTIDKAGTRLRAFVTPATTGDYRFYFGSDDQGVLAFNPDGEDPAGRTVIAWVKDWSLYGNYLANPSQRSAVFRLEAGRRYFIEAWSAENLGGDHTSIAWTGPGVTTPTPLPLAVLTPTATGCTGWCPPAVP